LNLRAPQDDTRLRLPEEEQSRADCYTLISRLFYAAPDAALLATLAANGAHAPHSDAGLRLAPMHMGAAPNPYVEAFRALQDVARGADAHSLRREYDDLFVGAGKALITPYSAGYAVPHAPDRHLVELRERLAGWGLGRREAVFEVEDHVSAVCDVMRWLIEHGRAVHEQRAFFHKFVYVGVRPFCAAVEAVSRSSFYGAVSSLAWAFLEVEKEAFDLHMVV
jgi:TorA maturation chaperone TorD